MCSLGMLNKSKNVVTVWNWSDCAVSLFCISLFPDVKAGVVRAALFKKERDRRAGRLCGPRKEPFRGRREREEEEMLGGCASY